MANSKKRSHLLLLTFIALSTSLVQAERWYEIELILFEQATVERLASEKWQATTELPNVRESRDFLTQASHDRSINELCFAGQDFVVSSLPFTELGDELEQPDGPLELANPLLIPETEENTEENVEKDQPPEIPYQLLDKSDHQLTEVYQQLRRRRGYRMLFHEAWRQPTDRKSQSLPIRIYAGKDYSEQFNYSGDAIVDLDNSLTPTDPDAMIDFARLVMQTEQPEEIIKQRFNQNQLIDDLMNIDAYFKLTKSDRVRNQLSECYDQEQAMLAKQRQEVWQIDGNIHIYTERFRHVETDLVIRFPDTEEIDLRAIETNLAANELLSNMNGIDVSSSLNALTSETPSATALNNNKQSETSSNLNWQYDENFLDDEISESTITRDVLKYYPLRQSRRIIDSKIHYFDHPLMGMIIQLRSYDPEAEDEQP